MTHLKRSALLLAIPVFLATSHCNNSKSNPASVGEAAVRDSVIVSGLQHPWEILWGPDDMIWMTERRGRISRVNPRTKSISPLITIADVYAQGEGGLLGMALHPDFKRTPHVFVAYNYGRGGSYSEKVVRYVYNGTTLTDPVIILDKIEAAGIHNGCRLLFGPDGKLYISTGDAADQSLPQNRNSLNGKILRINADGTIPADNPIAGNPFWSYGHRNAQGMVFVNGKLFVSEHGPITDDEINIVEKGKNFGWPEVHGYCDNDEDDFCRRNKVVEPIKAWTPTIAPCGMDYYNSNAIAQWKNSLLLVALKDARLYQMKLNGDHSSIVSINEYFKNDYGRLRDVCVSPSGNVYICSSNGSNDKIVQITAR